MTNYYYDIDDRLEDEPFMCKEKKGYLNIHTTGIHLIHS